MAFVGVTLAAAVFEGAGMGMLLPVMEYIEKGRDMTALAGTSKMWSAIFEGFSLLGLDATFPLLLLAVFLIIVLRVAAVFAREVYSVWLVQGVQHATRINLFDIYMRMEYARFSGSSTGRIVNVVTTETQRVCSYFISLFALVSNTVVVAGFLAVLLLLSVRMTLLVCALFAVAAMLVAYFVRWTKRLSRKTTDSNEAFSFTLVERLTAMRLLKLCAVEERERALLEKRSRNVWENMYRLGVLNSRVGLILEPCVVASGMLVLYSAVSVFNLGLAEVGVFMLILLRLLPLTKELLRSRQTLNANSASLQAVAEAFDRGREHREDVNPGGVAFSGLSSGIEYAGVTYRYEPDGDPALDDVRVFLPAGKMIALVGPSGSGKSTFADVLPGLLKPQSGRVLLDGVSLEDFDLRSFRRGVAFVSQEAAILNDTVLANVAFGVDGADREAVREALGKARALDFVEALPAGLDTVLGERGTKLSGGQRQRLSLARAFLRRTPVLILDEPTSALDSEVERDIQEAIAEVRQAGTTTVLIIAHRMSTIRAADKIVVLKNGRVVQEGRHDELMADGQWYSMVNSLQAE